MNPCNKFQFNYCPKQKHSNGLIYEFGPFKSSIRLIHCKINKSGTILSIINQNRTIFIVDLIECMFWKLYDSDNNYTCTVFEFVPKFSSLELLLGTNTGHLILINFYNGNILLKLNGHLNCWPINLISFSESKNLLLTSSRKEIIMWNFDLKIQLHKIIVDFPFKFAVFIPNSDLILSYSINNNIIQIWKNETFELFNEIHINTWPFGIIKSLHISKNGQFLIMSGCGNILTLFSLITWKIIRIIHVPLYIREIKNVKFISNQYVIILTSDLVLYFLDLNSNKIINKLTDLHSLGFLEFQCSNNETIIVCILTNGFLQVYNLTKYLIKKKTEMHIVNDINSKVNQLLDKEKLRIILNEFEEFPARYRFLIWQKILEIPKNVDCFMGLSTRQFNESNFTQLYPIEDTKLARNLLILYKNLVNWCPVLENFHYLPYFIFPFVNAFPFDPMISFEMTITVLMNWCFDWFDSNSIEYPKKLLKQLDEILYEIDFKLWLNYKQKSIMKKIYLWQVMQNNFSEILTTNEWLIFWDNVLMNPREYYLVAIIAYNLQFRSQLLLLKNAEQFERFFRNRNPLNLHTFFAKISDIFDKFSVRLITDDNLNADSNNKTRLMTFNKLPIGSYPIFFTLDSNITRFITTYDYNIPSCIQRFFKRHFNIKDMNSEKVKDIELKIRKMHNFIKYKKL